MVLVLLEHTHILHARTSRPVKYMLHTAGHKWGTFILRHSGFMTVCAGWWV